MKTARRVAALYDVHGNLPALEAVLEEVESEGIDRVVVGGDVLPGPMPEACLARLEGLSLPTSWVIGNGDVDTVAIRNGHVPDRVPEAYHAGLRWVADRIDDGQATRIAGWPRTATLEVAGLGPVLFCHAVPDDENAIFTRETPEEALRPIFESTGVGIAVCGHTHMTFDRSVGRVRVLNAGSIGMPFGTPGAHWLLLDERGPSFRRTDYDFSSAEAAIAATGHPDAALMRLQDPPSEEEMLRAFEAVALR